MVLDVVKKTLSGMLVFLEWSLLYSCGGTFVSENRAENCDFFIIINFAPNICFGEIVFLHGFVIFGNHCCRPCAILKALFLA